MCGIAAILSKSEDTPATEESLNLMLQSMKHRGPDTDGVYRDKMIGLAMNRLSIVGIENGSQPIFNENSSIILVCNGEIYNHQKLRDQLQRSGHSFSTHSDVEVIIHLYEEYGEKCMQFLKGIFAFALWDKEKQTLLVARDRMGVKPLYFLDTGTQMIFASETKALFSQLEKEPALDMQGFSDYHTFRFIPNSHTIFQDVKKISPAQYMLIKSNHQIDTGFYWRPEPRFSSEKQTNQTIDEKIRALQSIILNAVKDQFVSETKSGILLSGGLDSSALLAVHHKYHSEQPNTFTVAFEQPNTPTDRSHYSEIDDAELVAKTFDSNHTFEIYSAQQALEALPSIIGSLSEPIADPTMIPLWFASRLASKANCKVIFSGEGLDELFNGYAVYKQTNWLRVLQLAPKSVRKLGFSLASQLDLPGQGTIQKTLTNPSEWYQGIGGLFTQEEKRQLFQEEIWNQMKYQNSQAQVEKIMYPVRDKSFLQQMSYFDIFAWLPENTFVKSDNISMSHSVELRVPFVDNQVVEYALQTQDNLKLRWNNGKWIVKQALTPLLPSQVIKRKKAGFPIPLTAWIFDEWQDFVLTTLLDPNAYTRDFYREQEVMRLFDSSHTEQKQRAARLLWTLLTLELWYKEKQKTISMPQLETVGS
ncbi:asparagine synthase (glutamine-hydrolyzing) [Shimazuella sp. AN120528]|uniref:asparagine synthase (glutamine-hydrolyzing) n=1 Tax=Shimazuella soli TaxID=1892854 RepID=UPI001F0CDE8D|nr:asparagine synthase (glutamine-hydrolyzing) [Shimazuella soli]MCH5583393.1 asparagine synthase (glutamine-hydrolyzing) [Shimazuella soli]